MQSIYLLKQSSRTEVLEHNTLLSAEKDQNKIKSFKELSSKFEMKDLGKLSYFLGMSIVEGQEEKVT